MKFLPQKMMGGSQLHLGMVDRVVVVWSATSLVFTTTTISLTMVWILKLSELGDGGWWCQRYVCEISNMLAEVAEVDPEMADFSKADVVYNKAALVLTMLMQNMEA